MYNYEDYQTHICNHWLSKLGSKEMIENDTCELFPVSKQDNSDSMGEIVLYTNSKKSQMFKGKCHKCRQVGHKAEDYKSEKKKNTGKCNIGVRKQGTKKHNVGSRSVVATQERQGQSTTEIIVV